MVKTSCLIFHPFLPIWQYLNIFEWFGTTNQWFFLTARSIYLIAVLGKQADPGGRCTWSSCTALARQSQGTFGHVLRTGNWMGGSWIEWVGVPRFPQIGVEVKVAKWILVYSSGFFPHQTHQGSWYGWFFCPTGRPVVIFEPQISFFGHPAMFQSPISCWYSDVPYYPILFTALQLSTTTSRGIW